MQSPEKICPRCGCEYRHTATQCSDCRVELVFPEELQGDEVLELPPAAELVAIRLTSVSWARGFSEQLTGEGIPHRIEIPPGAASPSGAQRSQDAVVGIFVRPEDHGRATALDAAYARAQIPDLPEGGALPTVGDEGCPACGAACGAEAECPECGLYLGEAS